MPILTRQADFSSQVCEKFARLLFPSPLGGEGLGVRGCGHCRDKDPLTPDPSPPRGEGRKKPPLPRGERGGRGGGRGIALASRGVRGLSLPTDRWRNKEAEAHVDVANRPRPLPPPGGLRAARRGQLLPHVPA